MQTPIEWLSAWRWSASRGAWVLNVMTFSRAVAQHSAEQWQRTVDRPCQAIEYDTFCGQPRYTVIAPRLAGEWR